MFTACPGNFGTGTIYGGFSYGKTPLAPTQNPAKKKYKGPISGPRLNQRTVVTEYMPGTKPGNKRKRRK